MAIREAAANGHAEIVDILLSNPKVNPLAKRNEALKQAIVFKRLQTVKTLLKDPRVDPSVYDYDMIKIACRSNCDYCILKLLLKDIKEKKSLDVYQDALKVASNKGCFRIQKKLFKDGLLKRSVVNSKLTLLRIQVNSKLSKRI
jgi:hypothetical protein